MNIIIKKVRLVAAPEPAFVGTRISIVIPDGEARTYGIFRGDLAEGHEAVTVDWGDGSVETFPGFMRITHEYAEAGAYDVVLSDDVANLVIGCHIGSEFFSVYAPLIRRAVFASEIVRPGNGFLRGATNMTEVDMTRCSAAELPNRAFVKCEALTAIYLPNITTVAETTTEVACAFYNCPSLREIHFSAAHEASITASPGYLTDPTLGAPNAKLSFDL